MGLENGDIIRKVNSMPITSGEPVASLMQEFMKGGLSTVVIEFERNEEEWRVVYEIR